MNKGPTLDQLKDIKRVLDEAKIDPSWVITWSESTQEFVMHRFNKKLQITESAPISRGQNER